MTAGMVSVPTIVPLKAPGSGRKWDIDTATPIELATATKYATIFYTVDGTKPDPFKKLGESTTYRYAKPIYLGKGKIVMKAMAVLNDGSKESSVNTKSFQISEAKELLNTDSEEENEDEEDNKDGMKYEKISSKAKLQESYLPYYKDKSKSQMRSTKSAWQGESMYDKEAGRSFYENNQPRDGIGLSTRQGISRNSREMSRKEDSGVKKVLNGLDFNSLKIDDYDDREYASRFDDRDARGFSNTGLPRTVVPPKSNITAKHIQEETDFLKCVYCHAVRPADPFSRFCNECGGALPPIPGTRTIPPTEGKFGTCPFCHSEVPMNTPACVVCDARFNGKPEVLSSKLVEKVVCLGCGTSCPSGSKRCVVCESFLPVQKVFTQNVINKPPQPNRGAFLQCSKCGRVNSYDARFCDWCGSKPLPSTSVISCSTCRTSNQPYAKYCSSCGQIISPPVHPDYASQYPNQQHMTQGRSWSSNTDAKWHSIQSPTPRATTKTYGTQTNGIYFPSSKSIDAECKEDEMPSKTKRPLSGVSPGRGYWRQQMDHICQHLKIYAQNNVEFRDSFSQLRIGKLLGAVAQEELDGQELSLIFSFGLRNKDGHTLHASAKTVQTGMTFINALKNSKNNKDLKTASGSGKKKLRKKVKKKAIAKETKLSLETKKLFKILSAAEKLDPDDLHEFIDAGADVNAVDNDGMTVLKTAVLNKQSDCINILADAGADVDLKSGPKKNTALHDAVRLGMDGMESIDKLLAAGADADIKNDIGQTPYDLALKSGLDGLISKFTAQLGQDLLKETIG